MFTGLIEDIGRVVASAPLPARAGLHLTIEADLLREALPPGASLCTDGVCLTVTAWQTGRAEVFVGPETLALTTFGAACPERVNLERALRLADRLGGHLVSGHVDGMGEIVARSPRGEALDITLRVPAPLMRYVIMKGSIAVDGISLTVNHLSPAGIQVSLIPHTMARTTLAGKHVGDRVNLEVDLLAKYVERLLTGGLAPQGQPGLTLEKLKEHGFAQSE